MRPNHTARSIDADMLNHQYVVARTRRTRQPFGGRTGGQWGRGGWSERARAVLSDGSDVVVFVLIKLNENQFSVLMTRQPLSARASVQNVRICAPAGLWYANIVRT